MKFLLVFACLVVWARAAQLVSTNTVRRDDFDRNFELSEFATNVSERSLESSLTDFFAAPKKKSKNMVKSIGHMIRATMLPSIKQEHNAAQRELNSYLKRVRSCPLPGRSTGTKRKARVMWQLNRQHVACRKAQDRTYRLPYCRRLSKYSRVKRIACQAMKAVARNPANAAKACKPSGSSNYANWVRGIVSYFEKKRRRYNFFKRRCVIATRTYNRARPYCLTQRRRLTRVTRACNIKQRSFESATCTYRRTMRSTCFRYSKCHSSVKSKYRRRKPTIVRLEKERKIQYRVLQRISCLLKAKSKKSIETCRKQKYSTRHLNLKYPRFPKMRRCPRPALPAPCTRKFKSRVYKRLPRHGRAITCKSCKKRRGVVRKALKKIRRRTRGKVTHDRKWLIRELKKWKKICYSQTGNRRRNCWAYNVYRVYSKYYRYLGMKTRCTNKKTCQRRKLYFRYSSAYKKVMRRFIAGKRIGRMNKKRVRVKYGSRAWYKRQARTIVRRCRKLARKIKNKSQRSTKFRKCYHPAVKKLYKLYRALIKKKRNAGRKVRRNRSKRPANLRYRYPRPSYCVARRPRPVFRYNGALNTRNGGGNTKCYLNSQGKRKRLPIYDSSFTIGSYVRCFKKQAAITGIVGWGQRSKLKMNALMSGNSGNSVINRWFGHDIIKDVKHALKKNKRARNKGLCYGQYVNVVVSYDRKSGTREITVNWQTISTQKRRHRLNVRTRTTFCVANYPGGKATAAFGFVGYIVYPQVFTVSLHGYQNAIFNRIYPLLWLKTNINMMRRPTCAGNYWGRRVNLPAYSRPFTLEAYILVKKGAPSRSGIMGWGGRSGAYVLETYGRGIRTHFWERGLFYYKSRGKYGNTVNVRNQRWHHVATTFNGRRQFIWVDFRKMAERTVRRRPRRASKNNFCVGKAPGSAHFRGYIYYPKIFEFDRRVYRMKSRHACW